SSMSPVTNTALVVRGKSGTAMNTAFGKVPGLARLGRQANISTARPRESGDPLFPAAILTPGPRFRGGERRKTYPIVKQPSFGGPGLGRARGLPVSFCLPQMRGVARREGAWPGFRQTGPFFTGGPGSPGPWTPMTRASASSRRATRHYRFRVHGQSDRPAVSSAAGRLPECRPGTWLAFATLAGAASRPTFTTPRDDAPRWTGRK